MNQPVTLPFEIHDCWNRIGVWGSETPRCPKLDQVVHCRNCDVYPESGRRILERALPDDLSAPMERHSQQGETATAPRHTDVVVFRLGDEWLGLPAQLFSEITEMRPIHRLPHRSNTTLLGLVNIRGELKLCMSLGKLLGLDKGANWTKQQSASLPASGGYRQRSEQFVFPVSEVLGIERFNENDLHPAPASVTLANSTYTRGIFESGDKHIACLDDELLLYTLAKSLQDG